MTLACGIDVGGTKIAGGVVDEDGNILEELRVESPATDADAIEEAIAGLVTELRSRHQIETVGVGAAGYVDKARAVVLFAPNVAWRNEDLKGELEKRVELPVVIENDANAAAWGEFVYGAGHDVEDLLLVTVGTGRRRRAGPRRRGLPRRQRGGRRDRPHARGAQRHPVRLRQARLLRAVRQRLGAGARGSGAGAQRRHDRAGHAAARRRRPEQDHRPADHRGGPATATRARSSSWPSSAAGSARASRR